MLTKQSIKRPYTVVVLIIIIMIVGMVAVFSMPIDLLPNMEIPVMVVATVAPGQAPEEVEKKVTAPLENGLRQINNVTKINSISSDNVSIIIMQFSEKVDLTTATLDIQSRIKEAKPSFPSLTLDPMVMKIDPNLTPIMNIAISQEGKSLTESSQYLQDVANKLKAQEGVANVSVTGNVDNMVALQLDMEHFTNSIVTEMTQVILATDLPDVLAPILKALGEIIIGGGALPPNFDMSGMLGGFADKFTQMINPKIIETALMAHDFQMPAGQVTVGGVGYFVKVGNEVNTMDELRNLPLLSLNIKSVVPVADDLTGDALTQATQFIYYKGGKLHLGATAIEMLKKILPDDTEQATIDALVVNADGLLAQSVQDWFPTIPNVTAKMSNIAKISQLDNSSTKHTIINGAPGIMLSVMKQPGFSTVDVTKGVNASIKDMQKTDPSLKAIVLFDQGNDINFMIGTIVQNLLLGALFAIIILFIFLKDIRPTLTVGVSIFISVVSALALMYLCGVTLNLVSMGGLALAVGMLVDNSIVVIENIYRKRREGMGAIKAAYEGARQVSGAIISSTVTTVIVFLPIIFVNGMVKQIFMDLALTIAFSLGASLLVALTLVPMMASRILKKEAKPEYKFFDKLKTGYAKALDKALNKKWITIVVVLVLFAVSVTGVFFMDKELFPTAASDNFSIGVNVDIGQIEKENAKNDGIDLTYNEAIADIVESLNNTIKLNTNVENVGVELSSGVSYAGVNIGGGQVIAYVDLKAKYKGKPSKIKAEIEKSIEETPLFVNKVCSIYQINQAEMLGDVKALNVSVKGNDLDKMKASALELTGLLNEQQVGAITNGLEKPPLEYKLVVDRKEASKYGLMPAQVFLAFSEVLTQPSTNMKVRFDDQETSSIYVYSFDYDLVMWYRVIDDVTKQETRVYIGEEGDGFSYYTIDASGTKHGAALYPQGYFVSNETNHTLTKKSPQVYYEADRKEALDLVTHKLRFGTILGSPEMSQLLTPEQKELLNAGVEVYKLLDIYESCEKDKFGMVIYREGTTIPKAIAMQEGFASINREDSKRVINIKIKVGDNMTVNQAKAKVTKILDGYVAPANVSVDFVGEDELITTVYNSLYLILGLAIVLIYLVMVAQFQSLKSPLIIMFTMPLAFTGSILLLWACQMTLSVFAIVGLILLVGLVVNNGIVFVDYVNKLMLAGMSKREALLKTAQDRIRPILMTALTTIVALLASVFDFSPSAESIKPMAIATIGGLTYATVLTLFFVPIMYDLFNRKERVKAIKFDDDKEVDIEAEMRRDEVMQLSDVLPDSAFSESEKYMHSMSTLNSIEVIEEKEKVASEDKSLDKILDREQRKVIKHSKKAVLRPIESAKYSAKHKE